jgi:hypothetical protein
MNPHDLLAEKADFLDEELEVLCGKLRMWALSSREQRNEAAAAAYTAARRMVLQASARIREELQWGG